MNKGYIYAAAIVIIALVVFYMLGCNHGKRLACPVNKDTVSVKHDTVWTEVKRDTQYIPHIDTIIHTIPVPFYIDDTLYLEAFREIDTAAILKDYYAKRYYKDSQSVFDGYVLINDTISQNKITHREFIANFKIPHDSTTVTLKQPKRSIFYIGAGIMGSKEGSILNGVSASLGLKTKNDYIYEISGSTIRNNKPLYQGWVKIPIKFKK